MRYATARTARHPAFGAAVLLVLAMSANLVFRGHALATSVRIEAPSDEVVVRNGNIVVVRVTAREYQPGVVDRVEVAFDRGPWEPAERSVDELEQWLYFVTDPTPGSHELRARAISVTGTTEVSEAISITVEDDWTLPILVDNPYAVKGEYRKGQLHTHSTFSFDGWTSLHPGDLGHAYRKLGYSFVAITDHDVISNPHELNSDSFLAIPGYESTSDSGHITGLFTRRVVVPDLAAQSRLNFIRDDGGMAVLNHPSYRVGWSGTDLRSLQGCFAIELYNGATSNDRRASRAMRLWHDLLNARGYGSRLWGVAVDDAHSVSGLDRGWIMAKLPALTEDAVRSALAGGTFYASTGPSFGVLGVMDGAIAASSPDAASIRFIDQDMRVVHEGPTDWSSYLPSPTDRWLRVEAVADDGRTAWSQPFWLLANLKAGE